MKLAIVISQFPCNDEVFILRELRALQRTGFDMRIFSLKNSKEAPLHADAAPLLSAARYSPFLFSRNVVKRNLQLLKDDPKLYGHLLWTIVNETRKSTPFLWRSLAIFPEAVRWGMELREEPAERIHSHWATHPTTAGWVMSKISKIPLSITAHAHDIYLDQTMLAFKLREAVAVLTCTRQNLEFLQKLAPDIPDGRIRLSYHGLDLNVYKPAEKPSEKFKILSVGTLLPRKGFDILIEACGILKKEGVDFECNVVGDGPTRPEVEARSKELGLSGIVNFLGKQSQEKLPELYRNSSAFVLAAVHSPPPSMDGNEKKKPSASDLIHFGIPNVILEAMASGITVVTTRMTALKEIFVDGENGVYIPEKDPAGLAAALKDLALNPEKRKKMGAKAVERIREGFDIEVTISEVAEALGRKTSPKTTSASAST